MANELETVTKQNKTPDIGAGEYDEVGPDDSVSVVDTLKSHTGSEVSMKTTVSVLLYRTQQKEIELLLRRRL